MKLNWVTIYVSNLEKSLYFYTKILGLNVSVKFGDENHQIVMLGEADETKIELIFESNTKIENPGKGVSIGLETDNLENLIEELNNIGYKVTGPISPNPHIRFFFVQDPDGYTIQLIGKS
ncbi:VOC family protein [Tissierella pigra]|uniref:VOC family protein n=1 Tax=Tissierella pigra TaxID=2607614 RepID=A0A6N7XJS4_9FIRM|nr:VOC family protein [Tissierella pigra]MBU5426406.1 VOC family protein [Tissierella pigra]MSU02331.1 VOC family protein [Tissierella pigra]